MKTKTLSLFIALTFSITLLSGCATVFSGTTCRVEVKGSPEAKVYYNGSLVGNAPCMVRVNKKGLNKGEQKITIKSDGYKDQEITLVGKIKVGAIIGDLLLGIIPLPIDFITGAIYKADSPINYTLEK